MSVIILHLSDMHLATSSDAKNPAALVACFRELALPLEEIFIVVSGDVSFSGLPEEFLMASKFLGILVDGVASETHITPKLVVIPGNHDCHFPADAAVRDLVIREIRQQKGRCAGEEMLKQCLGVQDEFFSWLTSQSNRPPLSMMEKLSWTIEYPRKAGRKFAFLCLNTAWMSTLHEQQSQLFFPTDKIPNIGLTDVTVALLHHPYNWFESENSRVLRRTLEETCDLILTGHEHESEIYRKSNQSGAETEHLEGDIFNSDAEKDRSGFHIIVLDLENNRFSARPYTWQKYRYHLATVKEPDWLPFVRNAKRINRPNELTANMQTFLRDPGANLTHAAKTLELEDIFIPPYLRRFARISATEGVQKEVIESEYVINRVFTDRYAYFSGEGPCGKTSLAKMFFVHSLNRGLIPVYLTGDQFRHIEPSQVQKVIGAQYEKQYSHPDRGTFIQLPKEDKVIIIDDFFNTTLNGKARASICNYLVQSYGHVFVFGGDLSQLEEMIVEMDQGVSSLNLIHYEIMEFGYLLRERLIERWLALGKENIVEKEELVYQVNRVEKIVNTILGKNLLPSYPIFILVTLQQHEAGQDLNTSTGAYGYFYDVLITSALKKTSRSIEDVDVKYNYLGELAWYLFSKKRAELDAEETRQFTSAHWSKYRLTGAGDKMMGELLSSRILIAQNGQCSFRYKYIYYYFVARYIHNNINESGMGAEVDSLVEDLHKEEAANIIIFLTYLSRDRKLIDKLLASSRNLFATTEPCDLDKHIAFLNHIQEMIPQILMPDGDPVSRRREHFRAIDMQNENTRSTEREKGTDREKDEEAAQELSDLLTVNRALKSLQIMGQILRNFAGSLPGDVKLELVKECFSVGLRTLNSFFRVIENNLDGVIAYTAEVLGKDLNEMTREDRLKTAKQIVFFVTEMFGFSVIKRISAAVGSERLIPTYDDVKRVYDDVATEFVQVTIRMDHAQQFPEKRVLDLNIDLEKNIFAQTLLKMLVVDHLYLFPRPYKLQQKLSSKLHIQPTKEMVAGSPERKVRRQAIKKQGRGD